MRTVLNYGDPFGTHRSLEPAGSLPQPAWRLNNDFSSLFRGELLLAVETLNIDAASFRQMETAEPSQPVEEHVKETVRVRGKQHNPVTGSGGMLLGRVLEVAEGHPHRGELRAGDRVATLVSLSLTPLRIDRVAAVRRESAQLDVEGEAVLFATGSYAKLPSDLPERLALAALDVAGAAPQVARRVREGDSVLVLGAGGKSGIFCATEARRRVGSGGKIIGVESASAYANELRALGVCDSVLEVDATDPVRVREEVLRANGGREIDISFSCVNVGDTEMSAILPVRHRGTAFFFAMSTSFTKAALGAEGVGKDVELIMGNGYAEGHAEHSLDLLRAFPRVRALLEKRYG